MKPSHRIQEIKREEIGKDWVGHGGNHYSRERWMIMNEDDSGYDWRALMLYLDEKFSEN